MAAPETSSSNPTAKTPKRRCARIGRFLRALDARGGGLGHQLRQAAQAADGLENRRSRETPVETRPRLRLRPRRSMPFFFGIWSPKRAKTTWGWGVHENVSQHRESCFVISIYLGQGTLLEVAVSKP